MKKLSIIIILIVLGFIVMNNRSEVNNEKNNNKIINNIENNAENNADNIEDNAGNIENEDNSLKNTSINKYEISTVTKTKEIKNNEGITVINLEYSYPVIKNEIEDEFIDNINKEYKLKADEFVKEAEESKEDAQYLYEEMKEFFIPYTRELLYEVNMNSNGLLSITTIQYYNNSGVHGNFEKESRNFSMNQKKELSLNDIINDNKWNLRENLYTLFKEKVEKDDFEFDEITETTLREELGNVQYYIKEGLVVFYFNAEQVAPYALGEPTIEIPYNSETFLMEI